MNTRLLLFSFVLCLISFHKPLAQSSQPASELPNLSPISPEAFQFTKYGEVMVNESTGAISPSIPIHNLIAGDISIPITLSYSGNGVKVAQEPTWTGINWNMISGGVITRQVRDLPDEGNPLLAGFSKQAKSYSQLQSSFEFTGIGDYDNSEGGSWYPYLTDIATSTTVDSETDIFNYNFLGYSGSFYLNDNNTKGVLLNYNKELDISFHLGANNKSYIEIKTPQGDTYHFGGLTASESSRSWTNSSQHRGLSFPIQNAFYLYKITPYNNNPSINDPNSPDPLNPDPKGVVVFTYAPVNTNGYNNYVVDKQESLSKQEDIFHPCGNGGYTLSPVVDVYNEIESRVYLQKIESSLSNTYVEFSSSTLGNRKRKLNEIIVKDKSHYILKKVVLNYYSTIDKGDGHDFNKFYLESANFLDNATSSNEIYDYKFEYNSPELIPSRWSKAQDEGGYFNGDLGSQNTTLLPNVPGFENTIVLANRKTDFNTIKYGSLNKITYPTGGYSEFFYESPIKEYQTVNVDNTTLRVYQDNPYDGTDQFEETLWYDTDGTFLLNSGDVVTVNLSTDATGSYTHHNKVEVLAVKGGSPTTEYEIGYRQITNAQNTTESYSDSFTFTVLATGSYTFKLKLLLPTDGNGYPIFSTARFNIPNNDPTSQQAIYYPSLRVKHVISKTESNANPSIKRYYYNAIHNISNENNILIASPKYVTRTSRYAVEGCNGPPASYLNLSANSINNVYADDSGKILYPIVTVSYGGDNFELGAKESFFRVYTEAIPYTYFGLGLTNGYEQSIPVPYATNGISSGNSLLLDEKYYNVNPSTGDINLLKHSAYVHKVLDQPTERYNIKPGVIHQISAGATSHSLLNNNFSLYTLYSKKHVLKSITTTDYQLGQDPATPIVTQQTFEYNDYVDRHSSVETTDSKGVDSRTEFYYPITGSLPSVDFLSAGEKLDIQSLAGQHRFNTPYMVKQYYDKDNTTDEFILKSSTQTLFKPWANGKIRPQFVRTAKAHDGVLMPYATGVTDPYEKRIEYKSYNDFGRPEEVKLIDGTTTRYFYNDKQQVTRKIDNYNISDIDDTVDPNDDCYYQKFYPNAIVTVYEYDPNNGNLISIQDPRCRKTTYTYDSFNRLKSVEDHEGKVISENKYHYKGQQ